jgi:hypothetical protein
VLSAEDLLPFDRQDASECVCCKALLALNSEGSSLSFISNGIEEFD